jgi:hypothetical protein
MILMIRQVIENALLAGLLLCGAAEAGQFHAYVGQIESRSVLLAWGTTNGPNTIGRDSVSMGDATIEIGGQRLKSGRNWVVARGLEPDRVYPYSIHASGRSAAGTVRTYPEHTNRLRFFVIGDYGTGKQSQREIAAAMEREFMRLAGANDAPRFVITTGDNVYADFSFGSLSIRSGDDDSDWETKFFAPYAKILSAIPFYPSPGNHDGNSSESRADLPAYLDNFFFPDNRPARWYTFRFADLAQFFSLDTTDNTLDGLPTPQYLASGEQFAWLRTTIAGARAPWKIPYFHHPPFNAGPYHGASLNSLGAFCDLFSVSGVAVVFSGHEHNFQFSEKSKETAGIRYVISGAGGELRPGDVTSKMNEAQIAGWAPKNHFLSVEIEGDEMRITPIGANGTLEPVDARGKSLKMPLVVRR